MVELDIYKKRIINYICEGFNLDFLYEHFISDMAEDRVNEMKIKPALTYDRLAKKGSYLFTVNDYQEVISPHLPCFRESEDSLKVTMRWRQDFFILEFSENDFWVSYYQEENIRSFHLLLSTDIDPNELLYTICDIEYNLEKWDRLWTQLMDECKEDGRVLDEVRKQILKALEKEMRGTYIDYTVKAGPKTSEIQVETRQGQYFVIEVSNYDFERTLKNIGYFIDHTLVGLSSMDVEPKMKIGPDYINGVSIQSLPTLPIEQSPYIDVTRYIIELTDAVLHHREDDQHRLLPLANNVLGQVQLVKFAMALRGQDCDVLCDDTLYDHVSVFFPMRLLHDDDIASDVLSYYPLGCFCFQCIFSIDIEVPEEVVRDEWFRSDGLTIQSVIYEDEKTLVVVAFEGEACIYSVPVSFQGASIVHAVITEKDYTALCDVMDDGVFRLLARQ